MSGEPLCEGLAPFRCGNPACPAHTARPVWRPWRLELLPGVHQSVMLPPGASIDHLSAGPGSGNPGGGGIVLWLEVPSDVDPLASPTHRYVVVLPADAHPPGPLAAGGWLGDVLVHGPSSAPWDGTVFRCYEVEA